MRLVRAHRDLAMAELEEILQEVTRVAALAGVAVAALVLLGILFPVGLALFLGEWLFGSIGWGLLHGTLFLVAVAVSALVGAFVDDRGTVGRAFVAGLLVAIVLGVLLALDLPNQAWTRIGETVELQVDPSIRPLVVGTLVGAGGLGAIGLVMGLRGGSAGAGLIGGLLGGAALGAFSSITFGVRAGAGTGIAAGLIVWPVAAGASLAAAGVDGEKLKARFWPSVSVQAGQETLEWLRAQVPGGPRS